MSLPFLLLLGLTVLIAVVAVALDRPGLIAANVGLWLGYLVGRLT